MVTSYRKNITPLFHNLDIPIGISLEGSEVQKAETIVINSPGLEGRCTLPERKNNLLFHGSFLKYYTRDRTGFLSLKTMILEMHTMFF